jgi:hypothetical protein
LIDRLAALTGADVAASDDKTGHADLGGDWDLEVSRGAIEHATPFTLQATQSWTHILAPVQDVTGSAPASPDIGSTITLNLTFDNTAANAAGNVGYGPTIDLYLRATGCCSKVPAPSAAPIRWSTICAPCSRAATTPARSISAARPGPTPIRTRS